MNKVDLSIYNNSFYDPGSLFKRILWYHFNLVFFKSGILWPTRIKVYILKLFNCKIGKGIVIKPCINIKYPWFLELGNNVWLGENVWIDNLGVVKIGNNVCISQGALLVTGNHSYKKTSFDLLIGNITIEDGVWIGAKSVVCPGLKMLSHSILTVGSVLTKDAEAYTIYQGNPAVAVKKRTIEG